MQYNPHEYQKFCIDYLLERPAAGLFLKPGMGKTSVALTAAERLLYDTFEASKVLVIAPYGWPRILGAARAPNGIIYSICG